MQSPGEESNLVQCVSRAGGVLWLSSLTANSLKQINTIL